MTLSAKLKTRIVDDKTGLMIYRKDKDIRQNGGPIDDKQTTKNK